MRRVIILVFVLLGLALVFQYMSHKAFTAKLYCRTEFPVSTGDRELCQMLIGISSSRSSS